MTAFAEKYRRIELDLPPSASSNIDSVVVPAE